MVKKFYLTSLICSVLIIILSSAYFVIADNVNVDSIIKLLPANNKFTSGHFEIELKNSPEDLVLFYGNKINGFQSQVINLNTCSFDRNIVCKTDVNLSDFNNQQISYYYKFTFSGKHLQSNPVKINVDTVPPIIKNIDYNIKKNGNGIVDFSISLIEKNPESVNYIDKSSSDNLDKVNRLCASIKNQKCTAKIYFTQGYHELKIIATDKAGNTANSDINFTV